MFHIPDFIKYLPEFLIYIVSGYLFIKVFNFVSFKYDSVNISNILVSSISVGFISKSSYELVNPKTASEVSSYYIILCGFSILLGYVFALIYNSRFFSNILKWFKIHRTVNADIWGDMVDSKYSVSAKIQMKSDNGKYYYGTVNLIEENSRNPYIVLWNYATFDKDGNILDNYLEDRSHQILLDTKEAVSVELIYHDNSDLVVSK